MARATVMRVFEAHSLHLPPPDFPPRVQLEISNRCNLRCIMCTRNPMARPQGDMAFETVRKVADPTGSTSSKQRGQLRLSVPGRASITAGRTHGGKDKTERWLAPTGQAEHIHLAGG